MRSLLLLVLAVFAAACSTGGEDATSQVRFIHAAPGADSLDVFIDGSAVFEIVRVGAVTPYEVGIDAGEQPVRIRSSTEALELLRFEVDLIPDGQQTIIAAGARRELRPIVLADDLLAAQPDSAQVRIVHAAALSDSVDVLLTRPAADTVAAYPALRFRRNTGFFYAPPGTYRLRVTPAGGTTTLLDESLTLQAGDARTYLLADASVTGGLTIISTDD